ncbi:MULTISPECIES: hypothetical protein [Symbiopectobacterium]|nr:hypothetical protein [Candidatus Symbiopectobacterium endolongispinus]
MMSHGFTVVLGMSILYYGGGMGDERGIQGWSLPTQCVAPHANIIACPL